MANEWTERLSRHFQLTGGRAGTHPEPSALPTTLSPLSNLHSPQLCRELKSWLASRRIRSLQQILGLLHYFYLQGSKIRTTAELLAAVSNRAH